MIKHIVLWKFRAEVKDAEKDHLKQNMKSGLIGLVGKIPGLLEAEFVDKLISSSTHDMALIALFESEEALLEYKEHPLHLQVANTHVRPYIFERSCLDYELN